MNSDDSEEALEQRYGPRFVQADARRKAGAHAEAETAYAELANMVAEEVGREAKPYLLARYFLGLTRQDRGDDEGAIEPLREAFAGFEQRPSSDREYGLIGSALGLSMMRAERFAEAAGVFERARARLAKVSGQTASLAAILHNLAISRVRSNDVAGGLQTAIAAVATREQVSGANHPLTVETRLVEALARVEAGDSAGAAKLARECAAIILGGPGEAHPFFADALLVEARRVARAGDGPAAEALARRAMHLLDAGDVPANATVHRRSDARAIAPLWRTGPRAHGPSDVTIWKVSIQHTLRRYQPASLDFAGSGDRPKEWLYFAPASWPLTAVAYATQVVFADANATLNAREPADANFLDATSCEAQVPSVGELLGLRLDEMFRQRVWEPSIAFGVTSGAHSVALSPHDLALAMAAFLAMHRVTEDYASWLAPLGADLSEALRDPVGTLQRVLTTR